MSNLRGKKVALVTFVVLTVVLSVASFLYSRTDLREASQNFETNRAKAIKAGLAFDIESVRKLYEVDESDNAASLLAEIRFKPDEVGKLANFLRASDAEFLGFWTSHEAQFQKLELVSKKGHLMDVKEPRPPSASLMQDPNEDPSLSASLKIWIRFVVRKAEIASSNNQLVEARRLLLIAARLANLAADEPLLVNALRQLNCSQSVNLSLTKIISSHGQDAKWRQVATEVLDILDKPIDFASILKIEHWFSFHGAMVLNGEATDPHPFYQNIDREILFARHIPTFKTATYSQIDQIYLEYLASLPKEPFDYLKWQSECQKIEDIHSQKRLSMVVATKACFGFSHFLDGFHRSSVRRNLLRQTLGFFETNQDPAKGLPLKGLAALDLDGKPFRLKKTAQGWIIYSIGIDGVDNGGVTGNTKGFDIVMHLTKKKSLIEQDTNSL